MILAFGVFLLLAPVMYVWVAEFSDKNKHKNNIPSIKFI